MPKFIWICEITTEELYKQKQMVGEIIMDASANPDEKLPILALHYPDYLLLNDRYTVIDGQMRGIYAKGDLPEKGILSYPIYSSNLREV